MGDRSRMQTYSELLAFLQEREKVWTVSWLKSVIERPLARRLIEPLYRDELKNLQRVATHRA